MRTRLPAVTAAVILTALATPAAVAVDDDWLTEMPTTILEVDRYSDGSEFNIYSTTSLPTVSQEPEPFTVLVQGLNPVCSMTDGTLTRTSAPWDFAAQPGVPFTVTITQCNGEVDVVDGKVNIPFEVTGRLYPGSGPWQLQVRSYTGDTDTAVLRARDGTQVLSREFDDRLTVTVDAEQARQVGAGTLELTGGGFTRVVSLLYPSGWTPRRLGLEPEVLRSLGACTTVTWAYLPANARKGATEKLLMRDLTRAMTLMSRYSTVRFERVADPYDARLLAGWARLHSSVVAQAHVLINSGRPSEQSTAIVFNAASSDMDDSHAGFAPRAGRRGWVLAHEVGHLLGLGHVTDRRSLMYHLNTAGRLSQGDLEGLRTLYPRSECAG